MRGVMLATLAMLISGHVSLQESVLRPESDPHSEQGESPGCSGLPDYVDAFNAAINDHGDFFDFFVGGDLDTVQAMERSEIESLIEDGDGLLSDLEALDVPPTYRAGQAGFTLMFLTDRNYLNFLGLDTSAVPRIDGYDRGLQLVYDGELQAAAQCPKEVEQVGGYVEYDPASLGPQLQGN